MRRLITWFNIIIKKRKELRRWQRIVTVLAAIITFATTYALILPAITVEKDRSGDVAGLYLEQSEDDLKEENALESAGVIIDAGQENVAAFEEGDIVTDAEIPEYDYVHEEDVSEGFEEVDGEEITEALSVNTLEYYGSDYTVTLTYDELSGIPERADLTVSEIDRDSEEYQNYLAETKKAMGLAEEETLPSFAARFFDIKIMVDDQEFTPESGVSVEITYEEPLAENPDTEVNAVHFADEAAEAEVIEANTSEILEGGAATVEFTAESFSVYGVIYTVDFQYEADGKTYNFSIPGGGCVSFYDLVKILGIEADDPNTEKDEVQEWVDEVESITFSDPELVNISKVEENFTVGAIKERLQLECEYSAELTEEDIAEINAQEIKAGDWALISLKPFDTEESLMVTMKDGNSWNVRVTDADWDYHNQSGYEVTVEPSNAGYVFFANNTYYTWNDIWENCAAGFEIYEGGTNTNTIIAVAKDGYVFDHWVFNNNTVDVGSYGEINYDIDLRYNGNIVSHLNKGDIVPIIESGALLVDTGNKKVTAVFRPASTLNVTAGPGGTVSPSTSPITSNGNNAQQIMATASDGYWFDHWELDNESVSQEEGITNAPDGSTSVIGADALHVGTGDGHTLHAVFKQETRFSVEASEGGSVNVSTSVRTKDGYNKTAITATASDGYWFDHWEVDGETVEGNVQVESDGSKCVVPVGGIHVGEGNTLTAVFIPEVKYSVAAIKEEGGTAEGCTVQVGNGTPGMTIENNDMSRAGRNVEAIIAKAGPGYVFKGWLLDDEPILGGADIDNSQDGSTSTIKADTLQIGTEEGHIVKAVFAQEYTFTVSTSPEGAGTVKDGDKTPGGTIFGSMTKDGHNKYEIKATAQNGYKFSHWTMNGQVLKDDADNELYTNGTIPAGALTLTSSDNICAVFVKNTYTITVTNTGNGSTNVSSRQTESNSKVEKKANGTIIAYPNYGYKFAYWKVEESDAIVDWGDGCSAASSTIQPTVNRDITVTAVFVPDSYRTFTVTVDDPSHGTVFGKDANRNDVSADGVTSYVARTRGNNNNNNDQRIQVQTTFGGYEFVGWELVRSNGKVYQSYDSNNKLKGWRIDANSLNIPEDNMTLRAVFKEREVVPFDDPTMDDLIDWADGIADTDFSADKAAEVFDYDNRIYKLSLSASSRKQAIDSSVVINFITDVSRSMYFPANITEVGDYGNSNGNSSGAKLQNWLNGKSTDQVYYIILSQNSKATMYAVYHDGRQWRYVDASYYAPNSDDGLTMAGDAVSGVSTAPDDNYKIYQAPPREAGKPWSRLDYLCMSVEAAADVIYTICPNAQIDLTTFNRSAQYMGTLPTDHAGIDAMLRDIDVSGGTRQDLGLEKALPHFTNGSSKKQVAVLITDGAPNPADGNMTKIWQDINTFAGQMKDITDADGDHLELYTMGLSLKNVGDNEAKLNAIATIDPDNVGVYPNKYAKSVNSGQETSEAVKEIVNSLLNDVSLFGSMTDTVDPAFYPVDINGQPIQAGYYAADGSTLTSVPTDNTPYYEWTNNGGTWTITWHNQTFAWADEEIPGWKTNFYVKAKEDFLGGNKISTNNGTGNGLTATGYVKTDTSVTPLTQSKTRTFDYTPYVNVDELHMDGNDTVWTVYLGTDVDPKTQLVKLFETIPVRQVVKEGGTSEDIYITASEQMYYDHETVIDNTDEDAPENDYQMLPLSYYADHTQNRVLSKNIAEAFDKLLDDLKAAENGTEVSLDDIVYEEYGHLAGKFIITVSKQVNDDAYNDGAPDPHTTKEKGQNKETYQFTVQYLPYTDDASATYEHTTTGGTSGNITTGSDKDEVKSENSHIIHVIASNLEVLKVDKNNMPITNNPAQFTLYRKVKPGETADKSITVGGAQIQVKTERLTMPTTVNGTLDYSDLSYPPDGVYYLEEVAAPTGYKIVTKIIPIHITLTNNYTNLADESVTDISDIPYNNSQDVAMTYTIGEETIPATMFNNALSIVVRNEYAEVPLIVQKYIAGTTTPLPGATFKLTQVDADNHEIDNGIVKEGISDDDGLITFTDIAIGRYRLEETDRPGGYISSEGPYYINVNVNGQDTIDGQDELKYIDYEKQGNNHVYIVENVSGAALPNTGGPGTKLIYFLGIVFTCLAGAGLVMRKKRII